MAVGLRRVNPQVDDDEGVPLGVDDELVLATREQATLQMNLLGSSRVPLGAIEGFTVSSGDESLVTLSFGGYSLAGTALTSRASPRSKARR